MSNTRDRILDVSTSLFRRQGMTGTGIKQILAEAQAPFGSLYHHFPGGKDQLAAETIARAGSYYAELVFSKLTAVADPVEALRLAFVAAGETLVETDYADACPIETVALEVASTNETLRLATAAVFSSWLDGLAAWLGSPHAGGVPEPAAARSLAVTIIAALEGAFVLARSLRSTEPLVASGTAMAALLAAARSDGSSP